MPDEDGISRIVGRRIIEETTKFAAIAAEIKFREPFADKIAAQSKKYRHRYRVRPATVQHTFDDVRHQSPVGIVQLAQATVMAPTNATIKQPKKTQGDTGIGFREIIVATSAAQKGDRLNIVAVMMGWALLKPT